MQLGDDVKLASGEESCDAPAEFFILIIWQIGIQFMFFNICTSAYNYCKNIQLICMH